MQSSRIAPENQGVRKTPGSTYFDNKVEWIAEGLSVKHVPWTDPDDESTHSCDDVEHEAEYAPVRPYTLAQLDAGIVATIGSQRYSIHIFVNNMGPGDSWGDCGTPERAVVIFEPTDEPETPWVPWDEEATRANIRRLNNESIAVWRDRLGTEDKDEAEEMIGYLQDANARLEGQRLRPPGDAFLFGKPQFIQNPIFPALNGKAARCLMVLETGWGDCGNINLLFACDEDGVPCKVWFEASCC